MNGDKLQMKQNHGGPAGGGLAQGPLKYATVIIIIIIIIINKYG